MTCSSFNERRLAQRFVTSQVLQISRNDDWEIYYPQIEDGRLVVEALNRTSGKLYRFIFKDPPGDGLRAAHRREAKDTIIITLRHGDATEPDDRDQDSAPPARGKQPRRRSRRAR